MTQATLLRSVSLRDDLAVPARLAHYRPTRRSLPVTRAVLEGDATMVIAAYGSGKSLGGRDWGALHCERFGHLQDAQPGASPPAKGRPKPPCTGAEAPENGTQGAGRSAHWLRPGCGGRASRRRQD